MLLQLVKKYLSKHDLYKTDPAGETALHIACFGVCTNEKLSVVRILLENEFNPHTLNYNGEKAHHLLKNDKRWTLLQQACRVVSQNSSWGHQEKSPTKLKETRKPSLVKEIPVLKPEVKSQPKVKNIFL